MGLRPVAADDWLRRPADAEAQLDAKRYLVQQHLEQVYARLPDARTDVAIAETVALLRAAQGDARTELDDAPLVASGLAVCEDLCVLLPDDGDYVLHAALLCAPSFWRLREKIGQPLSGAHGPVAGLEDKIGQRIRDFLRNLPPDRIFTRGNWHLHNTAARFHPQPDDWTRAHTLSADNIATRLWVRCERQTLRKLPSGALLFTILVYIEPLHAFTHAPALAEGLWQAYLSMPENERAARHFDDVKQPLRRWLDTLTDA